MNGNVSINPDKLPSHIAIIMDGNGRWAKKHGKIRTFGHQNAVNAVKETVEACAELGIKVLTLYAFSTENWKRPKFEVNALMRLLVSTINKETKTLNENNIRLKTIGDIETLPSTCRKELAEAIELTGKNQGMTLVLALSYGSRKEISNAFRKIAIQIEEKKLKHEDIDEETIAKYLETNEFEDPQLLIRTSGEHRISNFLLWQIAYTEFYFTDTLWPDFRKKDLLMAISDYQNRERRFGKTSEQVAETNL